MNKSKCKYYNFRLTGFYENYSFHSKEFNGNTRKLQLYSVKILEVLCL